MPGWGKRLPKNKFDDHCTQNNPADYILASENVCDFEIKVVKHKAGVTCTVPGRKDHTDVVISRWLLSPGSSLQRNGFSIIKAPRGQPVEPSTSRFNFIFVQVTKLPDLPSLEYLSSVQITSKD